ncbi:hypothetical protein ACL6C3_24535 [Capilliphycus salinus ALCB114379]|uniref:hypothetical protein n=1 Tax=Capilliphycus salinus TaxID=2768948 RepID=UPI0039A55AC7
MAYRFYNFKPNGQSNPDGSPCQGIIYRSFTLQSYADQNWLETHQYIPGSARLQGTSTFVPLNFFEPQPLPRKKSVIRQSFPRIYASAGLR